MDFFNNGLQKYLTLAVIGMKQKKIEKKIWQNL